MRKLYLIVGIECLISFFLVSIGLFDENNELYFLIIVSISFTEYMYSLFKLNKRNELPMIFLFVVAYLVRMLVIYYDVNISAIEMSDAGDFRVAAEHFFYTNELIFRGYKAGFTTILMGIICKIFGPQRAIIQYCNTLCFLVATMLTNQILKKLEIKKNVRCICIGWMLFTPQNLLITSISSREGFIIFFIALSLYYAFCWTEKRNMRNAIRTIVPLLLGMVLHAGVAGVAVAYIIWIAFYDEKKIELNIKWNTVFLVWVILLLVYIIYTRFETVLFTKFSNYLSDGIVNSLINRYESTGRVGGSTYVVPGENVQSLIGIILHTPLRMIYFLLSPMPWYWRGVADVGAFIICSVPHIVMLYLYLSKIMLGTKPVLDKDKKIYCLLVAMMLAALFIAVIFGWGTRNAGTAIRHRDKFLPLYTIIMALLFNMEGRKRIRIKLRC